MNESIPSTGAARQSRWFIPALVVGWLLIGFGVSRALSDSKDAKPLAIVAYLIGFGVVHDLLIAPLVLAIGWAIGRAVGSVARGPVRAGAALSVIVLVFSYPLLRRLGAHPTNSSTLPLPYARNVVVVLSAVWIGTAVVILMRSHRLRRSVDEPEGPLSPGTGSPPSRRP